MKKYILIALQLLSCFVLEAQTGLGTLSPDPSLTLALQSTVKGFLSQRLTTAQRKTMVSWTSGFSMYNNEINDMEGYNGYGHQNFHGASAIVSVYANTTISTGSLIVGIPVVGVTQTIKATVTAVGNYSISVSANGITFAGSGTFTTTGTQNIVLTATGTPIAAATSNFVLNTTPNCTFNRIVLATPVGPVGGNAICDGSVPTVVVPIISITGKTWMDRNLGASREATSVTDYQAYGGLYQWGRGNDGHAGVIWTSSTVGAAVNGTTSTLATTDTSGNGLFITNSTSPYDWRSGQNNVFWQESGGINNPCPAGYRLPTALELTAEVAAYAITNAASAYASPLKFVVAGIRCGSDGLRYSTGIYSFYWSSTVNSTYASARNFNVNGTHSVEINRSSGFSVRCIKH
jgi:uncharacterized protein (TIGR02145 family)